MKVIIMGFIVIILLLLHNTCVRGFYGDYSYDGLRDQRDRDSNYFDDVDGNNSSYESVEGINSFNYDEDFERYPTTNNPFIEHSTKSVANLTDRDQQRKLRIFRVSPVLGQVDSRKLLLDRISRIHQENKKKSESHENQNDLSKAATGRGQSMNLESESDNLQWPQAHFEQLSHQFPEANSRASPAGTDNLSSKIFETNTAAHDPFARLRLEEENTLSPHVQNAPRRVTETNTYRPTSNPSTVSSVNKASWPAWPSWSKLTLHNRTAQKNEKLYSNFPQNDYSDYYVSPSVKPQNRSDTFSKNYYDAVIPSYNNRSFEIGRHNMTRKQQMKEKNTLESNEKLKPIAINSPRRKFRKSPCKKYITALRKAFEELEKEAEDDYYFDYDSKEERVQPEYGLSPSSVFGPSLHVNDSNRNGKNPNKSIGFNSTDTSALGQTDVLYDSITENSNAYEYDENMDDVLKDLPTESPMAYSRDEFEGYTQTESENLYPLQEEESYETTTHPSFDKGSESLRPKNIIFSNTTIDFNTPSNWFYMSTLPPPKSVSVALSFGEPSTPEPIFRGSNLQLSDTLNGENRDKDCTDKMLPCPDSLNLTYPLNGYCDKYVSCEGGIAIRRTCAEGLHFNLITRSCDIPHNSFCGYACPKTDGYYGIPGDCTGYFFCKNRIPEYRMCPPKMHWDIEKHKCTFSILSSCSMSCQNLNEVKPYKGDCKGYVICLNGVPFYHTCPPNMHFDSSSLTCLPYNLTHCQNDNRLLTEKLSLSTFCKDLEKKMGTKKWCNYFMPPEKDEKYY